MYALIADFALIVHIFLQVPPEISSSNNFGLRGGSEVCRLAPAGDRGAS
jgi:hypothetical protein